MYCGPIFSFFFFLHVLRFQLEQSWVIGIQKQIFMSLGQMKTCIPRFHKLLNRICSVFQSSSSFSSTSK